ncbi:MAG: hypothetical protein H0V88_08395 [Pyrinomonadaceae bacterium]|nr:hypothetical protein [Pyrinomonadaceae bacterium]
MQPESKPESFYKVVRRSLARRKLKLGEVCPPHSIIARRVLEEYGAIFVASERVAVPPVAVFTSQDEAEEFQRRAGWKRARVADTEIELQPAALDCLLEARRAAQGEGFDITPRGGREAARRSFDDSLRLWNSRFLPALQHWTECERLAAEEAAQLQNLAIEEQVAAVLELENQDVFFSKDFTKSILYSVAAPGASQHISMLAFDVAEFQTKAVREILAAHGWFQTVWSDLPHFTFLGWRERELPKRGLKKVEMAEQIFWIPNV